MASPEGKSKDTDRIEFIHRAFKVVPHLDKIMQRSPEGVSIPEEPDEVIGECPGTELGNLRSAIEDHKRKKHLIIAGAATAAAIGIGVASTAVILRHKYSEAKKDKK